MFVCICAAALFIWSSDRGETYSWPLSVTSWCVFRLSWVKDGDKRTKISGRTSPGTESDWQATKDEGSSLERLVRTLSLNDGSGQASWFHEKGEMYQIYICTNLPTWTLQTLSTFNPEFCLLFLGIWVTVNVAVMHFYGQYVGVYFRVVKYWRFKLVSRTGQVLVFDDLGSDVVANLVCYTHF